MVGEQAVGEEGARRERPRRALPLWVPLPAVHRMGLCQSGSSQMTENTPVAAQGNLV